MVNREKQRERAAMMKGPADIEELRGDVEETWEEVLAETRRQEDVLGLEPGTLGPHFFGSLRGRRR